MGSPPSAGRGSSTDEERLLAFLEDPATYPQNPATVEAIETHMSRVFIAGDLVYKMKKPVRLSFVDFTTIEARRRNSERELALNQRLAPGVYLGLIRVVRLANGALSLGGFGRTVEWLVVMRRLDQDRLLHRIVERGEARAVEIEQIGAVLACFYSETPRIAVAPSDWRKQWERAVNRVETSLADPRFALPRDAVARCIGRQRSFLAEHASLLTARAEQGRIVDGHGDLRPEHIFIGPPLLLIDRLEFNERLRWTDPFDEAVFLGLECERLGGRWIGDHLVRYLARALQDVPPPILLQFYRCYRASLRASLSIEHMRDPYPRTPERWPRQARDYLDLALAEWRAEDHQS